MIFLLSPAKTLSETVAPTVLKHATSPRAAADVSELLPTLKALGTGDLRSLMGISDDLAKLNKSRYEKFEQLPEKQAVLAYDGQAYKGLRAKDFKEDDLIFLNSHLRILSGLYGVLRPFDLIRDYRLEMGTKLKNKRGADLYQFWGDKITDAINEDLKALPPQQRVVVNVASQEYFKSVRPKNLSARVVTVAFPGPAVHAKEARGAIVRFAVERRLTDPAGLHGFTGTNGEWRLSPGETTEDLITFVRGQPKPKQAQAAAGGAKGKAAAGSRAKKKADAAAAEAPAAEAAGAAGSRKRKAKEEGPPAAAAPEVAAGGKEAGSGAAGGSSSRRSSRRTRAPQAAGH